MIFRGFRRIQGIQEYSGDSGYSGDLEYSEDSEVFRGFRGFQEIRFHLFQKGLAVEVIVVTAVPPEPLLDIHHAPLNTWSRM